MSIFKKVITALRGGAREVGEGIVDANATRIFEQEIRDAEDHLVKARRDLTEVMAQQMKSQREVERIKREISEHEGYASAALAKGDEGLALEVAERIAALEAELGEQQQSNGSFNASAERLKDLVRKTERQITDYKRQLSMVKTTDKVQKATSAISENFTASNSSLLNAKESLERIKARQQQFDDKLKAAEQLDSEEHGDPLQAKLKAAGIGPKQASANDVLARLRQKQS